MIFHKRFVALTIGLSAFLLLSVASAQTPSSPNEVVTTINGIRYRIRVPAGRSLTIPAGTRLWSSAPVVTNGGNFRVTSYPASSYPAPSYPTTSYPTSSYPTSSYPTSSYRSYPAPQVPQTIYPATSNPFFAVSPVTTTQPSTADSTRNADVLFETQQPLGDTSGWQYVRSNTTESTPRPAKSKVEDAVAENRFAEEVPEAFDPRESDWEFSFDSPAESEPTNKPTNDFEELKSTETIGSAGFAELQPSIETEQPKESSVPATDVIGRSTSSVKRANVRSQGSETKAHRASSIVTNQANQLEANQLEANQLEANRTETKPETDQASPQPEDEPIVVGYAQPIPGEANLATSTAKRELGWIMPIVFGCGLGLIWAEWIRRGRAKARFERAMEHGRVVKSSETEQNEVSDVDTVENVRGMSALPSAALTSVQEVPGVELETTKFVQGTAQPPIRQAEVATYTEAEQVEVATYTEAEQVETVDVPTNEWASIQATVTPDYEVDQTDEELIQLLEETGELRAQANRVQSAPSFDPSVLPNLPPEIRRVVSADPTDQQ